MWRNNLKLSHCFHYKYFRCKLDNIHRNATSYHYELYYTFKFIIHKNIICACDNRFLFACLNWFNFNFYRYSKWFKNALYIYLYIYTISPNKNERPLISKLSHWICEIIIKIWILLAPHFITGGIRNILRWGRLQFRRWRILEHRYI